MAFMNIIKSDAQQLKILFINMPLDHMLSKIQCFFNI